MKGRTAEERKRALATAARVAATSKATIAAHRKLRKSAARATVAARALGRQLERLQDDAKVVVNHRRNRRQECQRAVVAGRLVKNGGQQ